jgi:NADH:ubiquinone reductase (H+-translocating)
MSTRSSKTMQGDGRRPKVIIVGGGFGGLSAAKTLAGKPVDVTIIDRTNHHLFQPLLYQVATAGLAPSDIAQPIRHVLRDAENISVLMHEVEGIDPTARIVRTSGGEFPYDFLIVAAGARHSYFGHEDWEILAPGLKNLPDAIELRRRILQAFEFAETAEDETEREAALTFVIVGAGPTGLEMAGAISELAKRTMVDDFRKIRTRHARIFIIDGAPRVLPGFAASLSKSAAAQLKQLEVEVLVGAAVLNVTAEGVYLEDRFIRARTIIWAAGNAASPLGKELEAELDRQGRVLVAKDLSIPRHPEIFAIGDMASFLHQSGSPLAGVAPVAMQMGRRAAGNILALTQGKGTRRFRYFDKGNLATIGRNRAVADLRGIRFGGFLAWLSWLFVHLIFLIGLRNRVLVFLQWVWAYFTYARGARLIYAPFRPELERADVPEVKGTTRESGEAPGHGR